ncbi:MAG: GNAT family N-acetyltransferase [Candidatus Krumholzibacteriia bacterium]
MQVRRLRLQDHEAMLELWRRAGLSSLRPRGRDRREVFAQQLASGVETFLGLVEGDRLVGAVVATHDGRKGWINRLAVDPEYRRRGLARRLLAAAEQVLREQGMTVIAVLVERDSEASLRLFQREGYVLARDVFYLSKRDDADA